MDRSYKLLKINPYEDIRGCLKKVVTLSSLSESYKIEEVYLLYTLKGAVRGNHYHLKTLEYFIVVKGTALVRLSDIQKSYEDEIRLTAADSTALVIPPGVIHSFKNEEEDELIMLAVSTKEYNKNDTDTFPIIILN